MFYLIWGGRRPSTSPGTLLLVHNNVWYRNWEEVSRNIIESLHCYNILIAFYKSVIVWGKTWSFTKQYIWEDFIYSLCKSMLKGIKMLTTRLAKMLNSEKIKYWWCYRAMGTLAWLVGMQTVVVSQTIWQSLLWLWKSTTWWASNIIPVYIPWGDSPTSTVTYTGHIQNIHNITIAIATSQK